MRRFTPYIPTPRADLSKKIAFFLTKQCENKTSFIFNGKLYEFNDIKHLNNVINKMRREAFNKK